ncbi:hypothetical protein H6764_01920 [Candidatus Nomurabacteria bacterium]|nr:hypothetical protein [Candidatus Nomurabacteria bacterium]
MSDDMNSMINDSASDQSSGVTKRTDDNGNVLLECPECSNDIVMDADRDYIIGDILECQFCGTEVEIVSMDDAGVEIEIVEEEK